ncbi:hydrogenase maturation nickel metallochaperone HypA [Blautia liquoris]|uniref:Hydrogenase maturation factor HypA n=1 Tax=Blautia liquoris TaxID=2779518 RepID=A0A7M2RM52_9FIRM|nr:hydrogenase maturation nickel metallochaperone HypA [Blautia liquoris]QOV20420.1 hydrogenase maturation nickel metallochaperone HypA [Blautia liquoris]
MHEYPITKRVIEIAEEFAKKNQACEVKQIHLVVGDYCGYVGSSIELYFEIIAQDSICKHASLHIERVKPKLKCKTCGEYFDRKPFSFTCPSCGGDGEPTEIGREFYVKSIEI